MNMSIKQLNHVKVNVGELDDDNFKEDDNDNGNRDCFGEALVKILQPMMMIMMMMMITTNDDSGR